MTILVRQKKLALFLVVAMLFSMIPFGAFASVSQKGADQIVTFAIGEKSYQKGGAVVGTDVAPYIKDNRTMVPVAFVAPALGTDKAVWIPENQMVRITRGDDLIMIKIGSRELVVNGKIMMMDTAAEIKDIGGGGGRTMLPISFIARALGVGYQWNNQTRSVDFYGYSETFASAGTFGPAAGSETIAGNVFVTAPGVRLQNKVVKGDLIIAESVGTGDVFLDNITVEGNTYVRGGGKNSIHINGGSYTNVIIENTPDGGTRVVATNTDGINIVVATAQAGEQVILEGTFANVEVTAANVNVTTQGQTTIQNMVVNNRATVTVAAGTTVNTVTLNAAATVAGEGTVTNANVNVSGSIVATTGTTISTATGVTPPSTTTTTTPVVTPTGGGGGGGDDSPPPSQQTVGSITVMTSPVDTSSLDYDAGAVSVSLSTTTAGAEIRYTTDGSTPTASSTLYSVPFTVNNPGGINGGTVIVKAIGIKSGMNNSAVATRNVVYNGASAVSVTTVSEFQDAVASNVGTITLGNDITGNVTGTRTGTTNLTINFGNFVLTGNLTITADNITALNLTGSSSPAINGDMTITAGNATVTNGILVSGTINVVDTGDDSWIEQVDDNTIIVTDDNGASIVIQGNPADITIGTGANGITITASTPVVIIVNSGATVTNINATAPGTTITNNGTVTSVTADADVLIQNNSGDIAVTGTGTAGVTGTASGNVSGTNVVVITDISGDLTTTNLLPLKVGGTTTANIDGIGHVPAGGEYINMTSSAPGVVSVDSPTGVGITANTRGRAIITVKVFDGFDNLIKMGTISINVLPADITSASATMTAPAAGGTPQTGAQVESATGNADYTVSSVTWNQALTAAGKFKAGETYSATVVLTSKNNKAFQSGAFTPTVAGSASVGTTTTLGSGVGNRVTFTVTFPATAAKVVTGIQVTTQPTKMTYTEDSDDVLALNGMVITETYNDGTTGTVTFADGTAVGYTANPANGANLTVVVNNGNPVVITHTASSETANTGNLTVNIPALTGSPVFSSGAPPTFGTALVVGTGTLNVTTNLTHAWYRSDNNTFEEGTDISVSDPNGDTYIPVAGDVGKYIIVVVTSTDASGSATLTAGVPVGKAAGPATPDAPTLASKTATTVVLNTISGAEYAKLDNGGTWQDSPEFTGLTPSTMYSFGARIKETATHLASGTSDALNVTTEAEPVTLSQITGATVGLRSGSIIMGHSFNGGDVSYTQAISDTYGLDLANSNVSFAIFDGTNYVATGSTVALSALSLSDSDQPGESAKVTFADFQTMLSTFGLTMADPAQIPTHMKVVVRSKTTIGGVVVSNPWGPIDSGWILIDSGLVPDLVDPTNSSASIEVGNKTAGAEFPVTINIKDSDNNNSPNGDYGVMILVGETPVGGGSISFTDGQAIVNALIASAGTVNIVVKVNDITVDTIVGVVVVNPPILDVIETTFDGTKIMLTFDKNMADPVGKHEQFTVSVNGSGNAVTAAALNSVDAKTIDLTLTTALSGGETITIAYTKGTVAAADGGLLNTFTPVPVTNNAGDSDATEVTTMGTHYSVTVHGSSMIPADNPITANTTPITTEVTVGTFLGNLNQPASSQWKVFANANNPLAGDPPVDGVANFASNTSKGSGDFLAENDLLFVLAEDGTTLRGYHITVTAPASAGYPESFQFAISPGSFQFALSNIQDGSGNPVDLNLLTLGGNSLVEFIYQDGFGDDQVLSTLNFIFLGIDEDNLTRAIDFTDMYQYWMGEAFIEGFDTITHFDVTLQGSYDGSAFPDVVISDLSFTNRAEIAIYISGSLRTALTNVLVQANTLKDSTGIGTAPGQAPAESHSTFAAAIGEAEVIRDNMSADISTLSGGLGDIQQAITAFENSIVSSTLTIFSTNPEVVTAGATTPVTVVIISTNIPDATSASLSLHRGTPVGDLIDTETGTISSNTATINFSVPNTLEAGHFYFVATAGEVTSDGDLLVVGPSSVNSTVSAGTDPASPLVDNEFTIEVGLRDAIGTVISGIDGAYFSVTPWLAGTSDPGTGLVTIDSVVQDPGSGNYIITARYSAEETIDLQVGALNVLVGTIEGVSVVVP